MNCGVCGVEISKGRFCSQKCNGANRAQVFAQARASIQRTCEVCGVTFAPPRNSPRVTCSKACRYARVSQVHRANGVRPMSPPSPELQRQRITRENAPWWNGGRYVNDSGYAIVLPPVDFPFPEMCTRQGKIREHRMVMALHLGRALKRSEVVHHRDGNTLNNDISNLELFPSHAAHMRAHAHERSTQEGSDE